MKLRSIRFLEEPSALSERKMDRREPDLAGMGRHTVSGIPHYMIGTLMVISLLVIIPKPYEFFGNSSPFKKQTLTI